MKKSTKIIIGIVGIIILVLIALISVGSYMISENNPRWQKLLQEVEKQNPGVVAPSSVDISLMPMYGGFEKTAGQKMADEEFINTFVTEVGSREKASIGVANGAREWFEQGDLDTAMRRYNQAWLLDNNNPDVYIGFGDILKKRGYEKEAADMYKKAKEFKK